MLLENKHFWLVKEVQKSLESKEYSIYTEYGKKFTLSPLQLHGV
jgi:hypothetical protein